MDNVDLTAGRIRAFKDPQDETIRISSLGDLPASRLVWAGPTASRAKPSHRRLTALDRKDPAAFFSSTLFASGREPALPSENTRFVGSYRRKQGLGLRYTYSGFYGVNSEGSWWQVVVRCRRVPRGMPMGALKGVDSPEEAHIRRLVERSIEGLDQMSE